MILADLRKAHKTRSDNATRKRNENDLLMRQIKDNENLLVSQAERLVVVRESLDFLYELANARRGSMKGKIESVVSEALKLIYGPDYKVELTYAVKNNRSNLSIEMVRKTPQGDVRREIGGFGGGVADTISVPMRLMVLLGAKQSSRICVLDECYKHMDGERIELVAEFLKTLVDKLKMQIIMFTHHDTIRDRADKSFLVEEVGGKSKVTAI